MNGKTIISANLEHSGASRPGLTFTGDRINDMIFAGPGAPSGWEQKRWTENEIEYYDDIWGNLWARMLDGCAAGEVCKPAIENWEQLDDFQPPRFVYEECVASFRQGFAAVDDKFRMAGIPGWVFASSRYIRKMENYFMDMVLAPDELKRLHDIVAGVFENIIRAAGEADADGIFFCEDMGTQTGLLFSVEMWEDFFGELYRRLFALAHDCGMKVFMHSCGQNRAILETLLEAGVDCFQFDQPTVYDMPELAALLRKHKAALWAPVDIQKIMPTGDKVLIEKGVDDMFDIFNGFLIFKNYTDLKGIGVREEWDMWAYNRILERIQA